MEKEKKYLFDKPENVKRLLVIFFSLVGLLFVLDFFVDTHGHFPFEIWPAFYAIFGFVACVILVLVSRYVLRPLVKRREDYYE
ncbi:MAG: hypothetical protein RBQ72_11915 [Desulfobacterium sp.]|jgi:hypothetical protein|nr:hypothetical protein [Desulfobacterium sp.]